MGYRSTRTHGFKKDSDLEIVSSQGPVLESGLSEHGDGTHLTIDMNITHQGKTK